MTRTVARLRPLGETIFSTMSNLARAHGAVNLGQGAPDFDGPAPVLAKAQQEIAAGNNQYPPDTGHAVLREAICAERAARLGHVYDPDTECIVTVGATEAITAAVLGLVEPGQTVVLIEPYYDSYLAAVVLAGAQHVSVPLVRGEDSWRLDAKAISRVIEKHDVAMIIVNSPHNPTGTVLHDDDLAVIADAARRADAIVFSDEVYEHLIYDGGVHRSIVDQPGMRERSIVVSSAAKTFNVTGWKTGWALAPADLVEGILAAKQFITCVGCGPVQPAVAVGLTECGDWIANLRETLEGNRDYLLHRLHGMGIDCLGAEAGYFVVADARPLGYPSAMDACLALPEAAGVAGIPVSAFVDEPDDERWRHGIRFGFCKKRESMTEALDRLETHLARVRG